MKLFQINSSREKFCKLLHSMVEEEEVAMNYYSLTQDNVTMSGLVA